MLQMWVHKLTMNIVIICKRRPQQKDLWERPNGRFYHFAKHLAEFGHCVDLVLVSYRNGENFVRKREGITWHSVSALPVPFRVYYYMLQTFGQQKPDWVLGVSDTYFGILAVSMAKRFESSCLVDAYDNYESYVPWFKPLHWLWRYAMGQADVLSAPGNYLLVKMVAGGSASNGQKSLVLPMAADEMFRPLDKVQCRTQLGLPLDKKLVGYCGSLHQSRDISALFGLAEVLAQQCDDCLIVVTGRKQKKVRVPDNILYLGYLEDAEMPAMFNALDVQVVFNKPGGFGNYSYPVKIYEALACHVPVLASRTPSVAEVLDHDDKRLFEPGNTGELLVKIKALLSGDASQAVDNKAGWREIVCDLSRFLFSSQVVDKKN